MKFLILYLVIHEALFIYAYGFQRVTLSLSREHKGFGDDDYQSTLTPGWLERIKITAGFLSIVNIILVAFFFGLLGSVAYIIFWILAIVIFHLFFQRFTFSYYFNVIIEHLERVIRNQEIELVREELSVILREVVESKRKWRIGSRGGRKK